MVSTTNQFPATPSSISDAEIRSLPAYLQAALAKGNALLIDELEAIDFELYLEGMDEKIFNEKLVRTGMNGNTRLRLFAIDTNERERDLMNFPKFKKKLHVADFLTDVNIHNLNANIRAKNISDHK